MQLNAEEVIIAHQETRLCKHSQLCVVGHTSEKLPCNIVTSATVLMTQHTLPTGLHKV